MEGNYFIFNGQKYYSETIVEINHDKKKFFGYRSVVKFFKYDANNNMYYFIPIRGALTVYEVSEENLSCYINNILAAKVLQTNEQKKLDPKYIDGIVGAWIWYILIMIFGLFIKGTGSTIVVWVFATYVFFDWRKRKMNGE